MTVQPPPITEAVVDESGLPSLAWTLFFNQNYAGDAGVAWTPEFEGLTKVGDPKVTGRYYRLSQYLCYFHIHVVPETNTSATAGTTYINNFPLDVTRNGFCIAVSGNLGGTPGMVEEVNNRIYVPAWTTVSVPLTIIGICEAR